MEIQAGEETRRTLLKARRARHEAMDHFYREQLDMLDEQLSSEQKERQFREKVQRSTAMKLEAEMRAEGAALLDGLKGQLAHMAAVDYGVPTSPY